LALQKGLPIWLLPLFAGWGLTKAFSKCGGFWPGFARPKGMPFAPWPKTFIFSGALCSAATFTFI
jgi:hypothetical protein